MPSHIWEAFSKEEGENFIEDGYMLQDVGGFVQEAKANNYEGYDIASLARSRLLDEWFTSQGATIGSKILVHHG